MLCDICHTNKATIHATEVVNNSVIALHLCENCSKIKKEDIAVNSDIAGLLPKFFKNADSEVIKCPFCGFTDEIFLKKSRLGCAKCYQTFEEPLMNLLKNINGSIQHRGKSPKMNSQYPDKKHIEELQNMLDRAIELEEYEEAAWINNQIKKLKGL
jgi:protein arginine kinase activator